MTKTNDVRRRRLYSDQELQIVGGNKNIDGDTTPIILLYRIIDSKLLLCCFGEKSLKYAFAHGNTNVEENLNKNILHF